MKKSTVVWVVMCIIQTFAKPYDPQMVVQNEVDDLISSTKEYPDSRIYFDGDSNSDSLDIIENGLIPNRFDNRDASNGPYEPKHEVPRDYNNHAEDHSHSLEIDKPQPNPSFGHKIKSWASNLYGDGDFQSSVSRSYNQAKDSLQKTSGDVWNSIKQHYQNLHQKLLELKQWFSENISGFGVMVQKGATYIAERCFIIFDEAEATDILNRLKEKLKEGDETVSKFFDIIGQKLAAWSKAKEQYSGGVDDGLNNAGYQYSQHFGDPHFPDLLQDEEIQNELNKLVRNNVLQQKEVDLLSKVKQI